jgi:hypothetical protein
MNVLEDATFRSVFELTASLMIVPTLTAFYLALAGLGATAEGSGPPHSTGTVVHYSFEQDDDRDFDGLPDNWTRRTGAGFPAYVETEIDAHCGRPHEGETGGKSLQFRVNGGPAILYSPPIAVDALHSYVFEGFLRTEGLESDAAIVSVSFLNHKRERIARYLTAPVSGTNKDWVRVPIVDMAPPKEASFAVIGCHLVQGRKMDIHGSAWFDDLSLGALPQMTLVSNFQKHFVERQAEIQI